MQKKMGFVLFAITISALSITISLSAVDNCCAGEIEGLVGGWLFDEGKGKVAKDISLNEHDGEVIDAKWVSGKFGKALEFGPENSYVRVKHHEDFNLESYTIAAWVRGETQATWQTIISKTNGVRNYGMFVRPDDGNIHFNLQDPGDTRIDSQEKVTDGKWHYVVMTVSEGTLCGYIDGKKEETTCGDAPFNDTDVTIGAGGDGTRYWMMGSIDDVAIFNRVLDEEEIEKIMNKGLSGAMALKARNKLATCWGRIKTD